MHTDGLGDLKAAKARELLGVAAGALPCTEMNSGCPHAPTRAWRAELKYERYNRNISLAGYSRAVDLLVRVFDDIGKLPVVVLHKQVYKALVVVNVFFSSS